MQIRPKQGKLKMAYELNTDSSNYNRHTLKNRIKTHVLDGTPVPPNTNYSIGCFEDSTLVLCPLRQAVQMRTNFDHIDVEHAQLQKKVLAFEAILGPERRKDFRHAQQGPQTDHQAQQRPGRV